jgi:hypothetical protein
LAILVRIQANLSCFLPIPANVRPFAALKKGSFKIGGCQLIEFNFERQTPQVQLTNASLTPTKARFGSQANQANHRFNEALGADRIRGRGRGLQVEDTPGT